MFKQGSFEQELIDGMKQNLVSNELENKWSFDKIAKAADYISIAAEIFDDTGMHKEAEVLTRMLEKLANTNFAKQERGLEETGTPFQRNEFPDLNHLDSIDLGLDDTGNDFEEEAY